MGIRALAEAEQGDATVIAGVSGSFEQGESGGLADGNPGAVGGARAAGLGRDQFERGNPIERVVAQAAHAADHGGVAEPELHHPPGGGEDLGAGGTGGGYGGGRAAKTEIAPDAVGTRAEIV